MILINQPYTVKVPYSTFGLAGKQFSFVTFLSTDTNGSNKVRQSSQTHFAAVSGHNQNSPFASIDLSSLAAGNYYVGVTQYIDSVAQTDKMFGPVTVKTNLLEISGRITGVNTVELTVTNNGYTAAMNRSMNDILVLLTAPLRNSIGNSDDGYTSQYYTIANFSLADVPPGTTRTFNLGINTGIIYPVYSRFYTSPGGNYHLITNAKESEIWDSSGAPYILINDSRNDPYFNQYPSSIQVDLLGWTVEMEYRDGRPYYYDRYGEIKSNSAVIYPTGLANWGYPSISLTSFSYPLAANTHLKHGTPITVNYTLELMNAPRPVTLKFYWFDQIPYNYTYELPDHKQAIGEQIVNHNNQTVDYSLPLTVPESTGPFQIWADVYMEDVLYASMPIAYIYAEVYSSEYQISNVRHTAYPYKLLTDSVSFTINPPAAALKFGFVGYARHQLPGGNQPSLVAGLQTLSYLGNYSWYQTQSGPPSLYRFFYRGSGDWWFGQTIQ